MNKTFFYGNVASDPELKGSSKNVLTWRTAVNSRVYNADKGEWVDAADFFDCVLYGKRAEAIGKFLAQGMPVTLECHAKQNTWQDKDGNNRSRVEFVVDDIQVGRKA
ncbi:Helix-destabilizing protein [Slackia heliotrinireducens]|uniref:Single-stranded DNA-binding protein n=1 Tax=Slackia heliotrinireducens (strain ATCC 29202 / DSM 20476 / NCTC 11029 / RHS 1) TaxID=471855 RepID=C7N828_SLAHD|nr:single-stranded DNA-binding protein [Slackia heliotrinireducens]ACV23063.1 single-stranded DNA-binding protein [Slackia heliotrinireducens DSM 20476]VEH02017.1 Helix-destabilizing protein [Slackia heliotrinireducens]